MAVHLHLALRKVGAVGRLVVRRPVDEAPNQQVKFQLFLNQYLSGNVDKGDPKQNFLGNKTILETTGLSFQWAVTREKGTVAYIIKLLLVSFLIPKFGLPSCH